MASYSNLVPIGCPRVRANLDSMSMNRLNIVLHTAERTYDEPNVINAPKARISNQPQPFYVPAEFGSPVRDIIYIKQYKEVVKEPSVW